MRSRRPFFSVLRRRTRARRSRATDRRRAIQVVRVARASACEREGWQLPAARAHAWRATDLQPESRVVDLLHGTGGRVSGVEVRRKNGRRDRIAAGLVIGADGRHSTVARLVAALEYLGYDGPRASYWAYWQRPHAWDAGTLYNEFEGEHSRVLFPTDEDHVLVATVPISARARTWRHDPSAAYLADVRSSRTLGPLFGEARPLGRVRVLAKTRYFFRAAAGPGWALAGDAGHHKEFVIGLGHLGRAPRCEESRNRGPRRY